MAKIEIAPRAQRLIRYGSTLVIVAGAFLARQALVAHLGAELPPYVIFYPAIMLVAIIAGLWPGVLATLLATLLAGYWILPPQGQFAIERFADAVGLGIFLLMGVFISLLAEGYRRNRQKAAAYDKEAALRESRERLRVTLTSIGDAVIATDSSGKITFLNPVAAALTGWQPEEAHEQPVQNVFRIINEQTRVPAEDIVARVLKEKYVVALANHTALLTREGREIPIEDSAAPIRDNKGRITGVVLVFHDISEKRKAEKALRDSERLATTGRLASTLAHEIHNPLEAVVNLLFLIEQAPHTSETVRQYTTMAGEELARVTQMTRHMLAFQREAAKPVPIKIGEILDNVIALYEKKIESAGVQVQKEVEFEQEFLGLPGEMRQVLANLIGNAIEAIGKNGKLRLHAYPSRDWRRGQRGLRVAVADNGPGIPPEVRDKIFDPFFTTKGESGTGLGLWITSGIIEKNEGKLRLRTVTRGGRSGTCFSVFFPFPS